MALPPITPVTSIPPIIPNALCDFEVTLHFSISHSAAPAPTLHKNMFARYWYEPSLILSGILFFQLFFVKISPAIPPVMPPSTGIKPNKESLPISEKISFEVTFSGSGINEFSNFLPSLLFSSALNNVFNSLYFKIFVLAFSRI